jgi:hypothetical protein
MTQQIAPSWDFCLKVGRALQIPAERVFRIAGLLPSLPPAVEEERDVVAALRMLPAQVRETILTMIAALSDRYSYRSMAETPPAEDVADSELERAALTELRQLPPVWQEQAVEEIRRLQEMSRLHIIGAPGENGAAEIEEDQQAA